MKRRLGLITVFLMFLVLFSLSLFIVSRGAGIKIVSMNLSHRVVVLDQVETRLKLLIGFTVTGRIPSGPADTRARGSLRRGSTQISKAAVPKLDYPGGNLVFYMPYDIAPGSYDLELELIDIPSDSVLASKQHKIDKIETVTQRENVSGNWMQPPPIPLVSPAPEAITAEVTPADRSRGYVLWHRNPLEYVYETSAPRQSDVISEVSVRLARNEYEPATFSLRALADLGEVHVLTADAAGSNGSVLPATRITTHIVKAVPRCKSPRTPEAGYEMRPRLLERSDSFTLEAGESRRIWLAIQATPEDSPGTYSGEVTIRTRLGSTAIPLRVEVLPIELVERPDKEYAFLFTYVFQEITARDLTEEERGRVYENGLRYYRSFREHGLTSVIVHSPFTFQRLADGSPDLRDLEAALRAFREVGFTGPFIYYCGHLVQSAKPGWPGSTRGFEPGHHPALLQEIITYARRNFADMESVDVHWMPGDEIHDPRGGPDRLRIGKRLLEIVMELGGKTVLSAKAEVDWPVDIRLHDQPKVGQAWHTWTGRSTRPKNVDDAASMRAAFGLAHVRSPHVGLAPWTFQTSQHASGDPYTDLDGLRRPEVMVAYPGTAGPISTPEYEALREGIDDGRYAFLLETRIAEARQSEDTQRRELAAAAEADYRDMLDKVDSASATDLDLFRDRMVEWILKLGP